MTHDPILDKFDAMFQMLRQSHGWSPDLPCYPPKPGALDEVGFLRKLCWHLIQRCRTFEELQIGPEGATLRDIEVRHIRRVFAACGGRKAETAARLGINRTTLYNRLREAGLK